MGNTGAAAGTTHPRVTIVIDAPPREPSTGVDSIEVATKEPGTRNANSSPFYMQTDTPMKEEIHPRKTSFGRQVRVPTRLGQDDESNARPGSTLSEGASQTKEDSSDEEESIQGVKSKRRQNSKQVPETLESLQKRLDEMTDSYEKKNKEHKLLKKVKADFVKQNTAQKKQIKELEKTIKDLKGSAAHLQLLRGTEKVEHGKILTAERESFYKAQASLQGLIQKNVTPEEPDDVVRRKCKEIQAGLQQWAKDWAGHNPKEGPGMTYVKNLLRHARVDQFQPIQLLWDRLALQPAVPATLLLIGVARITFNLTLGDRFGNLEAFDGGGGKIRTALHAILELGSEADQAKLHGWRASTRSLFEAIYASAQLEYDQGLKGLTGTASVISETLSQFYARMINEFVTTTASCLLKSVSPEEEVQRHEELLSIFQAAGDLAARLWSQKTSMVVTDGMETKRLDLTFDIDSPLMEAHRSMGCDNESHEFDGSVIDLVLVPGILAYGSSEGKQYDKYKVWMKSTVLVLTEKSQDTSSHNEQTSEQGIPLSSGRKSPRLDAEESGPPTKRVKIEGEESHKSPAAANMTELTRNPVMPNLKANTKQNNDSLALPNQTIDGLQKPKVRKPSANDAPSLSAAATHNSRPVMTGPAPSNAPGIRTSGSQIKRNVPQAKSKVSLLESTLATIIVNNRGQAAEASEKAEKERCEKEAQEARRKANATKGFGQSATSPKQQVEPLIKKEGGTIDLTGLADDPPEIR